MAKEARTYRFNRRTLALIHVLRNKLSPNVTHDATTVIEMAIGRVAKQENVSEAEVAAAEEEMGDGPPAKGRTPPPPSKPPKRKGGKS